MGIENHSELEPAVVAYVFAYMLYEIVSIIVVLLSMPSHVSSYRKIMFYLCS